MPFAFVVHGRHLGRRLRPRRSGRLLAKLALLSALSKRCLSSGALFKPCFPSNPFHQKKKNYTNP